MTGYRAMHYVMGTLLDCTLFDVPEADGPALLHRGLQEVRRLERLLSIHDPDSALSQLNRQAGAGLVPMAMELWHLLAHCVTLTQQTAGAFDVRTGSASQTAILHVPSLHLPAEGWVALTSGVRLDLGGIGKGYAVDRLAAWLQGEGVSRAFINFGESSLCMLGTPPESDGWPLLVRGLSPGDFLGVLWCGPGAISTSHGVSPGGGLTLDPRTGLTVAAPALSTILAPSATLAEALSTATLVHGPAWRTLVDRFPGVEGLYVGPDGIPQYSQGLGERLQLCAEGE